MTMMHQHLTALLDAGYEVTLTSGGSVDSDEYYAHVRLGGGPLMTGEGKSPAEALWTASPLHGDDEPFPDDEELTAEAVTAIDRRGFRRGYERAGADRRQRREELMAAFAAAPDDAERQRLVAEWMGTPEDAGKPATGVDSHVWYCAKCGGTIIGPEPFGSVCRGCGGQ